MAKRSQKLELTWYNKHKALIPVEQGKYGYAWVDRTDPRYCETHTLVMGERISGEQALKEDGTTYSERADLTPTEDNLLILGESGDVLEALTRVPELREQYAGQVKLVYIDPPFNTAQTFANYEDNLEHSVWLTMMRDRLEHLKDLLAPDGSIWVHLDDVENHRMRVLMDEVFGAQNFVSEFIWQKRTTRENRSTISIQTDSIAVYSKSSQWKNTRNLLPREGAAGYSNPDNDPRGPWTSVPFTAQFNPAENERWSQRYTLELPSGVKVEPPVGSVWRFTEPRYNELRTDGRLWFGTDGNARPRLKKFLTDVAGGLVPFNFFPASEVGTNDTAKREIQALFPDTAAFATPKPERLLERIIHIATNPGDIVLDVFAGSGTTAAVAHKMGRRWVTCELVEDTFDRFTKARLTKVVHGEDLGGVTATTERVAVGALPNDVTPKDAQDFNTVLSKVVENLEVNIDVVKKTTSLARKSQKNGSTSLDDNETKQLLALLRKLGQNNESTEIDLLPDVTRALRKETKTKEQETINWRGGGSFRVATLSPTCFDYDSELQAITLTDAAVGDTLIAAVAAQLSFTLTPSDPVFHGRLGNQRLVVIEGMVVKNDIDFYQSKLAPDETLVIAATALDDGVRAYQRKAKSGSVVKHIPDDLFLISDDLIASGDVDLGEDFTPQLVDSESSADEGADN